MPATLSVSPPTEGAVAAWPPPPHLGQAAPSAICVPQLGQKAMTGLLGTHGIFTRPTGCCMGTTAKGPSLGRRNVTRNGSWEQCREHASGIHDGRHHRSNTYIVLYITKYDKIQCIGMKVKSILPEWPERLRHFTYAAWKKLAPMWASPQDRPEQSPPQVG